MNVKKSEVAWKGVRMVEVYKIEKLGDLLF